MTDKKPALRARLTPTQGEMKKSIEVGPNMGQVSSAAYWFKHGHFTNEDEARGAFKLAQQQGLDGMGASIPDWMGMTDSEYDAWMRGEALPGSGR